MPKRKANIKPRSRKKVTKSDTLKKKPVRKAIKTEQQVDFSKYEGKYKHELNKKYTKGEIEFLADEMLTWFGYRSKSYELPKTKDEYDKYLDTIWLRDIAQKLGTSWRRFSEFAEKNDYFHWALETCKDLQETKLVRLALSTKERARVTFIIFALKNVAKWRDSYDITEKHEFEFLDKMDISEIKSQIIKYEDIRKN